MLGTVLGNLFPDMDKLLMTAEFPFFGLFTVLSYALASGFMTLYGAMYLLSLFLAFGVTMRMKKTIEVSA